MRKIVNTIATLFLVGSSSNLQITRTGIKSWIRSISSQTNYSLWSYSSLSEKISHNILSNVFIALKGTYFRILFAFTAAGVVQCGGRKTSPRTSTIVQFIFHFRSFEISERILRSQKLSIGLDSYSRQIYLFIYRVFGPHMDIYISL